MLLNLPGLLFSQNLTTVDLGVLVYMHPLNEARPNGAAVVAVVAFYSDKHHSRYISDVSDTSFLLTIEVF